MKKKSACRKNLIIIMLKGQAQQRREVILKIVLSAMISAQEPAGLLIAQIMGMCDLLTLALGKGGYNSHKLVLFGEFRELFPWLLRRLDENRDILGGAQKEVPLLEQEIGRRMRNAKLVKTLLSGRVRGGGS